MREYKGITHYYTTYKQSNKLYSYTVFLTKDKAHYITTNKRYKSRGIAKRAAIQVAGKVGIQIKWSTNKN